MLCKVAKIAVGALRQCRYSASPDLCGSQPCWQQEKGDQHALELEKSACDDRRESPALLGLVPCNCHGVDREPPCRTPCL